jgi:hypothetical protein
MGSIAFQQGEYFPTQKCSSAVIFPAHHPLCTSDTMDGKKLEYKGEAALKEIERLTEKADEVQKNILKEILTRNRETEYLNKYMKGSKDVLEFKRNVPVITYMGVRPFIQRIANGEDSSLITGHPITEMLCRWSLILFFTLFFFLFFF